MRNGLNFLPAQLARHHAFLRAKEQAIDERSS